MEVNRMQLISMEHRRQICVRRIKILIVLGILVFLGIGGVGIYAMYYDVTDWSELSWTEHLTAVGGGLLVGVLAGGFVGFFGYKLVVEGPFLKLRTQYKETLVRSALENLFSNLEYDPKAGFRQNLIEGTCMVPTGNRYKSEDYIRGTYKGIVFEQADVTIKQYHPQSGNRGAREEIRFDGRWMIFQFSKQFSGYLRIKPKGFLEKLGIGGLRGAEKVKTRDEEFNRRFEVVTTQPDQVEHLLNPQFLERLYALEERMKNQMVLCFQAGQLHVAVDGEQDSMEIDLFKAIDPEAEARNIRQQMDLVLDLVNSLALDRERSRYTNAWDGTPVR